MTATELYSEGENPGVEPGYSWGMVSTVIAPELVRPEMSGQVSTS